MPLPPPVTKTERPFRLGKIDVAWVSVEDEELPVCEGVEKLSYQYCNQSMVKIIINSINWR